MADQAASAVASAVIGGIADRTLTLVTQKLHSPPAAHEKLLRLELLVLKVRSAIEVSEKHAIESASLLQWRDRLKEAAAEAGEVLLQFQRRATEEAEAASSAADHDRQQTAAAGALYFTRISLSGMAQRVRDAARRLFSTNEDTKNLDRSLERMEQLSPDIAQFVTLLQIEVSPKRDQGLSKRARLDGRKFRNHRECEVSPNLGQQPTKTTAPKSSLQFDCSVESSHKVTLLAESELRLRPRWAVKAVAASEEDKQLATAHAAEAAENEARVLGRMLKQAQRRIILNRLDKATDDTDMEGLEWLAQWAAVLREAVERCNAVRTTLRRGSHVSREAGGALEADGEFYSFARAVEWLASDLQCFDHLASLCPWKQ